MPVRYRVLPELNLLYYAGFGHCTGSELFAAEVETSKHPQRIPDMKIIIDATMVTELDIDREDLTHLIEFNRQLVAQGRKLEMTAIIARHEPDFLLSDLVVLLADDSMSLRLAAFNNLLATLDWLGLSGNHEQITALRQSLRNEEMAALAKPPQIASPG